MTSEAPGQVVLTSRSGVVRSSLLVLIGRLAFGVTVVVQNVVFARVMGAQEFGLFLLVQSLVLPVAIFAVFGLDSLAIRELRDPQRNISRIAPASFLRVSIVAIAVVTSIAVAALLPTIWAAEAFAPDAGKWARIAALWPFLWPLVFFSAMQLLLGGMLRAVGRIVQATFLTGVFSPAALLAAAFFAFGLAVPLSLGVVLAFQVAALAGAVGLTLIVARRGALFRTGAPASLSEITRVGPALMLTQVLALVVSQSDIWVFGLGAAPEAVAQYGVATRVAQLVSLPHLVLNGVLPQRMAEHLGGTEHRTLELLIRASVAVAALPSLILCLIFVLFGRDLLGFMFGPFYCEAATSLVILAAGNVVNVCCGPCSQLLIVFGRQDILNRITAINCTWCIAAGLAAAFWLGALGVAAVYAIALSAQGFASVFMSTRVVGVRTYWSYRDLINMIQVELRARNSWPPRNP